MTFLNKDDPIRFYGRRSIRGLKATEKELLETVLPPISVTPENITHWLNQKPNVALEIGFGGGEHLASQAMNNPDTFFVGCEPFVNGVVSLLRHIRDNHIQNIAVFPCDARLLLDHMPSHCLNEIFLLFPDPWPKARHAKRRFVQQETLAELERLLKPGGLFKTATDHPIYQSWVLEQMATQSTFKSIKTNIWERSFESTWPQTRYEQKALLENKKIAYFIFERL